MSTKPLHKQTKDLTGQTFGDWTVLEFVGYIRFGGRAHWLCECKCGQRVEVAAASLINGLSLRCKFCSGLNKNRLQHGHFVSQAYFNKSKTGAARRNYDYTYTIEDLEQIAKDQNKICTLSGIKLSCAISLGGRDKNTPHYIADASLDRIDNNEGYIKGNGQWVHKDINMMKGCLTQEDFIMRCNQVAKTHPRDVS